MKDEELGYSSITLTNSSYPEKRFVSSKATNNISDNNTLQPPSLPSLSSSSFSSSPAFISSSTSSTFDKSIPIVNPSHSHELSNTSKFDAGLRSDEFYKSKMSSSIRFKLRSMLLPLVELESNTLSKIQDSIRTPFWDLFFMYSSTLGSHTFYVLLLPAPGWFGFLTLFRDLVIVLGLGIYLSGVVKDYLCLPRPKSPPLHRLTLSSYTAEEYGCPSSHTANATSVTMILLWELFKNWQVFNLSTNICFSIGLISYWVCLVFGRIYCGMHGFVDITFGGLIGIFVVVLRKLTTNLWDEFIYSNDKFFNGSVPIITILLYYSLIYFHVLPIDSCPCFEDSIAFIGVLLGLDLAHWSISNSRFRNNDPNFPCSVPYSFEELGLIKTILRVLIGITCVIIWKIISKPILLRLLKPIHKLIFGDLNNNKNKKKEYEHSNENENGNYKEINDDKTITWAFIPRYDLAVIVKMLVYCGIAVVAVYVKIVYQYLGLSVEL